MEPATGIAARLRALRPLRRLCRLAHFAGQCSALPQLRARNRVRSLSARKRSEPGATRAPDSPSILWSQRQESNPQPNDYKSFALPLSHAGTLGACARSFFRILKPLESGKTLKRHPRITSAAPPCSQRSNGDHERVRAEVEGTAVSIPSQPRLATGGVAA